MRSILIVLLALFALSACELFELRKSSPPSEDAAWNDFPSEIELALQNLEYAYEDSRNAVNYSRLFPEDYRFFFAAQDITDFSTDSEWSRAQELDMLLNLHTRYSSITIELEPMPGSDELGANEAKIYRAYSIKARTGDTAEVVDIALGNMELHYKRLFGRWYIHKWYDYRSGSAPTWGLMKHENS